MTESDKYKKIICTITEEECNEYEDCSICVTALDEEKEIRETERLNLLPNVITMKKGVEFKRNGFSTVAEFSPNITTGDIIDFFGFPNRKTFFVPYDMRRIIARWPHFVKVKNMRSMGIPNIMVEICNFLIAYYDHGTFVSAPRLTKEEFNDKDYDKQFERGNKQ